MPETQYFDGGLLTYVRGDATNPPGPGEKLIVHVCNDIGAWGAGFVLDLSRRWPQLEGAYRTWHHKGLQLGNVQFVRVELDLAVANLIGQCGIRSANNPHPLDYGALEKGLVTVAEWALEHGATIHMPRIGCGLAGGSWDRVEALVMTCLCGRGLGVTVYDL